MSKLYLDYLVKEELEYELEIRGVTNAQNYTNKDMIRILRGLLMNETEHAKILLECNRPVNNELTECKNKLDLIKELLVPISTLAHQRRLETKLSHVISRLERINTNDEEMLLHKSQLLTQSANAMVDFKELLDVGKKTVPLDPLINIDQISPVLSTPVKEVKQATVNVDESKSYFKHIPVSKWNIKFSGESNGMGLNEFFERVHELALARGVSKSELFTAAVELLEGKALVWFRCASKTVNNWDEVCDRMKEEFLPNDYSEKLWEEIKKRTQGENESVGLYLAVMDNLFNRLNFHLPENVRLRIICKNLLPYYQKQLALIEIISESQLRSLCKKIESSRDDIKNFKPPNKNNCNLEIDLAYSTKKVTISNIEMTKEPHESLCKSMKNINIGCRSMSQERSGSVNQNSFADNSKNKDYYKDYRTRSNSRDRGRFKDRNSDGAYRTRYENRDDNYWRRRESSRDRNYSSSDDRVLRDENRNSDRNRDRVSKYNQKPQIKCFRCQRVGHMARFCDYPMLKCFTCGKPGFTKLNCPKCNNQGNYRRGQ